jgi:hypothetical protein
MGLEVFILESKTTTTKQGTREARNSPIEKL